MGSRRKLVLGAVAVGAVTVAACAAAAPGSGVRLVHGPGRPLSGHAASIVVASNAARVDVWIAKGQVGHSFAARARPQGRFAARVVFPTAGRWAFGARAGGPRVRLGSVRVRPRTVPLGFTWPTSVDVARDGSLLLVENGINGVGARVLRIASGTHRTTVLARVDRAYSVAVAPPGSAYLSAGHSLLRLVGAGGATPVAQADTDIGPVAVAANGDVYFETATQVFRLAGGTGAPTLVADGLSAAHGLAVTGDGGLLVSDTGHRRIERVDLGTEQVEPWGDVGQPRGISLARDGTVYVADGSTRRVVHLMADGRRLGATRHVFDDPYDVAAAADGSVYVVDSTASGRLYRVAPDGAASVVSRSR